MMTLEQYLRSRYAAATVEVYRFEIERYLQRAGGEAAARTAGYAELVAELTYLRGRYASPATVHRILAAIKCYYRYLLETGQRADHPGSRLQLRDRPAPGTVQTQDLLSAAELARLLQPRPERYPMLAGRNRVIVGLLVHQALTAREIGRLRVGDVDLSAATVWVRTGNRSRGRGLALVAGQVMQLHDYLTNGRPRLLGKSATDHLILTGRGTPERGGGVQYLVETLRDLVPDKRVNPLTIRQSVLALKLREGTDLRKVQVFAGHRTISSTERYRETDLEELQRAVERFHPLRRSAGTISNATGRATGKTTGKPKT